MPHIVADRVRETSTTTGTGSYALAGASANFRAFSGVCANADTVDYAAVDSAGAGWEVGRGTWSTGNTLARTTIFASSNGGAAVNWSAGTRDIFLTSPATFLASRAASGANSDITSLTGLTTALSVGQGGTGATSLTANNVILGNGTSTVQTVAPGTSGNVLTSNGTTWVSQAPSGGGGGGLTGVTQSTTPFETALGFDAGLNTTGVNNTFVGYQAGRANTTGTDNTAVGHQALVAVTTGSDNVALGSTALGALTNGNANIAIGSRALDATTTGGRNIAIGIDAMGFGVVSNATGYNVAIGESTGVFTTTAQANVYVGLEAGFATTTGSNNVALGRGALDAATTGGRNVAIGLDAMGSGVATAATGDNIAIGFRAGFLVTSGTDNVFIGETAGNATTTGSNQIVIGQGANASSATVSNEITLGNASVTRLRIPGIQAGASNGHVLTFDSAQGILNLQAPSGGLSFFTTARSVAAPNTTVPVHSIEATGTEANIDVAIVPKGTGAFSLRVADDTAAGGEKRGANAVDLQTSRAASDRVASGQFSAVLSGSNNRATGISAVVVGGGLNSSGNGNIASGRGSFVGGGGAAAGRNTASGEGSVVVGGAGAGGGSDNTASGDHSFIGGGWGHTASGAGSVVTGGEGNLANAYLSCIPGGGHATTNSILGLMAYGFEGSFGNRGRSQMSFFGARPQTTDATARRATSNNVTAAATNQLTLRNDSAFTFRGMVAARDTSTNDMKSWEFTGAIKRGSGAGTTAIVGTPTTTVIAQDTNASTWTIALSADTTNGALAVNVTGQAAKTINWTVVIHSAEVG